ncbi:MAG: adenylate/guanylate cyclase domain-containing protein [Actinomycetota bacterium]
MDWGAQGNGMEQGTGALLSVLFTDIEGSTALTEQLGDELWVDVLSAHDAVIRRALAGHGGHEVKTVGDGVMAVFGRAAGAVRAALELQARLRLVQVPSVPEGLRVRVGVHAGPVVCRGGDVLGRNVNMARRITTEAAGGEVLVSSAVKALVAHDRALRPGRARSLHLRGIAEPQVVFAMAGPPAGADGPAGRRSPLRRRHLRLVTGRT